jgi:putative membrane protein
MRGVDASAVRLDPSLLWPAAAVGGLVAALATIAPLLRLAQLASPAEVWFDWPLTPGITLDILIAAWLYLAGQREPAAGDRFAALRHLAFFGGLAALFLALESPIEPLSDHLFMAHQVEHMFLRTTAPVLLVLAAPQAALLRGMPDPLRRWVVAPMLGNRFVRALGILGHPAIATALFIGTTYFWMIPRFYDLALLNESVHIYLWHTTLLLSGLIFFWRLLDPRPPPHGAPLGVRLFMFWIASIGNILLGSYLTFKDQALYHAYDEAGRLFGFSAVTDEKFGGLVMWIPGSMMFCMTGILMIFRWAQQEERHWVRRGSIGAEVVTAAAFRRQRRPANRKMAFGLVCFMATVLAITFGTMVIYHYQPGVAALGLVAR